MAVYLRLDNLKTACDRDSIWCALCAAFDDIISRDKKIKISKVKSWSTIEAKLSDAWDLICNQGWLQRLDKMIEDNSSIDVG